jgi:hypothetical protein
MVDCQEVTIRESSVAWHRVPSSGSGNSGSRRTESHVIVLSGALESRCPAAMRRVCVHETERDWIVGRRIVKLIAVMLAALVFGYLAALGIGIVAFDVFDVSQREGAAAMGLAFFIGPLFAIIASVFAGAWYWVHSGRKAAAPDAAAKANGPGKSGRRLGIAGAAVAGYLAGLFLQWMLAGRSYETFAVALAVSLAPWIAAAVSGAIAWAGYRQRGA